MKDEKTADFGDLLDEIDFGIESLKKDSASVSPSGKGVPSGTVKPEKDVKTNKASGVPGSTGLGGELFNPAKDTVSPAAASSSAVHGASETGKKPIKVGGTATAAAAKAANAAMKADKTTGADVIRFGASASGGKASSFGEPISPARRDAGANTGSTVKSTAGAAGMSGATKSTAGTAGVSGAMKSTAGAAGMSGAMKSTAGAAGVSGAAKSTAGAAGVSGAMKSSAGAAAMSGATKSTAGAAGMSGATKSTAGAADVSGAMKSTAGAAVSGAVKNLMGSDAAVSSASMKKESRRSSGEVSGGRTAEKKPVKTSGDDHFPKNQDGKAAGDPGQLRGHEDDSDMKIHTPNSKKEGIYADDSDVKVAARSVSRSVSEPKNDGKTRLHDTTPTRAYTGSTSSSGSGSGKVSARKSKKKKKKKNGGIVALKVILYIAFVVGVSVLLANFAVSVANDVFAFIKDPEPITVTLDEGLSTKDVAALLGDNGVIKYPTVFRYYTEFKKGKSTYYTEGYKAGEYEFIPAETDYDDLIYALSNNVGGREIVRLTFPEGSTVNEIIDILIKGGVQNTKEQYVDVIQNYDFDYRFVKEMDVDNFKEGRVYRLEGYLFPDTYEFYTDESPESIINKFLINFDVKFEDVYYTAAANQGLTVDDVVILASMIEKEAKLQSDVGLIASVFRNRLKNPGAFPYLQSDATIQYAFPERKSDISPEDLKYQSPYNTYLNKGLPPSAIANPGLDAIDRALFPDDSDYYYFVANELGETFYAKTLEGHNANIQMIKKAKEQE